MMLTVLPPEHHEDPAVVRAFQRSSDGRVTMRAQERYQVPLCAPELEPAFNDATLVVPMASSLDDFGVDLFLRAQSASLGKKGSARVAIVVLHSAVERLKLDGKRRTAESCLARLPVWPHQFMPGLATGLGALAWLRHGGRPLVVVSEHEEFLRLCRCKHHLQACKAVDFFSTTELAGEAKTLDLELQARQLTVETDGKITDSMVRTSLHWGDRQVAAALATGDAFEGRLKVDKIGRSEAVLVRPGNNPDGTVLAVGPTGFNRAVHGDDVIVSGEQVVAVTRRNWRPFVVSFAEADSAVVFPMDRRIPKIRVVTRQARLLQKQRFVVQLDEWPLDSRYPVGHYTRTLGPIGEVSTESMAILVEAGLEEHLSGFSSAALGCLPRQGRNWVATLDPVTMTDELGHQRRDLRRTNPTEPASDDVGMILSVDPPGCMDIDDALSYKALPNGNHLVGVHIADVTHFIPRDSALDREAARRATSVYLQDRRLDMLPRLLCEDLCSLCPGVDRYAVSVIWELDKTGSVVKEHIGRTVIRSVHALSYLQAQRLMDGDDPGIETILAHTGKPVPVAFWAEMREALRGLDVVAQLRLRSRRSGGAISLESGGEFKFRLDAAHRPDRVNQKQQLPIHGTIAELMILANQCVAQATLQTHPTSALLRRHEQPPLKKLQRVLELANQASFALDASSNVALAASMQRAQAQLEEPVFAALNAALTRAMSEAKYVVAAQASDFAHFGLGIQHYTHFTSPIRRYADIIVHRLLLSDPEGRVSAVPIPRPTPTPGTDLPIHSWAGVANRAARDEDLLFGNVADIGVTANSSFPSAEDALFDSLMGDSLGQIESVEEDALFDALVADIQKSGANKPRVPDLACCSADIASSAGDESLSPNIQTKDGSGTSGAERQPSQASDTATTLVEHINHTHRAAKEASFRSQELFFSLYFQRHPQRVEAVILVIREDGLECYCPEFASKFVMRYGEIARKAPSSLNSLSCSGNGVIEVVSEPELVVNLHSGPAGSEGFTAVSLSAASVPFVRLRRLDRVQGYVFCDEEWSIRIPRPKLVLYVAPQGTEDPTPEFQAGPKSVKEFVRLRSPRHNNSSSTDLKFGDTLSAGTRRGDTFVQPASSSSSLYSLTAADPPPAGYPSPKKVPQPCGPSEVLTRGRFRFGFASPVQRATGFVRDNFDDHPDTHPLEGPGLATPNSFSSIQHDRRQVERYVSKVSRDATRRIEALAKAKRETKVKARIKAQRG